MLFFAVVVEVGEVGGGDNVPGLPTRRLIGL